MPSSSSPAAATSSPAGAGPEPEGKGAQTRSAILAAAIARFGRDGFKATKVADIARDAEVGNSLVFAYFPNKEALFLAALDEDAAEVIEAAAAVKRDAEPVAAGLGATLFAALVSARDDHPLARRVLAGLEPHATERVLDIPALAELRKTVAEELRAGQMEGRVRADIDPVTMANGATTLSLSLLMSMLQFGVDENFAYAEDVLALFQAAIERSPDA